MKKATVFFTDFRCSDSENLQQKFTRLLKTAGLGKIDLADKLVAIKTHFGEPGCLAYLRPNWAKTLADFVKAQHLLFEKDSVYNHLYRTAFQLSLIQKAAPKLEKVKAKEQELFAQLQTTYDGAKNAVTLIPSLAKSMENLDEKFAKYKVMSEKIQAMEYKPFIQRIKDYLIGLACVAIIILFFNLILSKLQALKKARQAAKQYQEALDRQGGGVYPTI